MHDVFVNAKVRYISSLLHENKFFDHQIVEIFKFYFVFSLFVCAKQTMKSASLLIFKPKSINVVKKYPQVIGLPCRL